MTRPDGYPATPNLDKQSEIMDDAYTIGAFIDFLFDDEKNVLARYELTGPWNRSLAEREPVLTRVFFTDQKREAAIAKFFGIDYDALLKERDAVYQYVSTQWRNSNG